MAGIDIRGVPYKDSVLPGVSDLIAGKIQLMIFSAGSAMAHVRAGKMRALAVTSAEPSALAPGLPTAAATLPGYESVHVQGVYAPAHTPAPIIDRLNREIVQLLKTAAVKAQLLSAGIEAVGTTPEVLAVTVKCEIARVAALIKSLAIKTG
jgi:tripartite-type tricarboxylate transporter receptor subunit TctC